jgi:hypothetical protein
MNSSRRSVRPNDNRQQPSQDTNEPDEVENIKKIIIFLNSNIMNNKDELYNSNPIKFKINFDPREIKYIKEIQMLPFYIPKIIGLNDSDKIYITIDELTSTDDFHFICIIEVKSDIDAILVKPQNIYQFYDNTHRLRSNIMSISFRMYDYTVLPLEYAFSVGVSDSMMLSRELINYIEEKKIHAEIVISYVSSS